MLDGSHSLKMSSPSAVVCREIRTTDREGIVNLLTRGFGERDGRVFWERAFDRLTARQSMPGYPRYGYLLESAGRVVGGLLTIFSVAGPGAAGGIRCNLSSWFVEPGFRTHGSMLVSRALRFKNVTYTNITAVQHTWPMLEAQGYKVYCRGMVISCPAVTPRGIGARVEPVPAGLCAGEGLGSDEVRLLEEHAAFGCISLVVRSRGRRYPFVFTAPRARDGVKGLLPYTMLVYCRDIDEFRRFAGPIGRFLLGRGVPLVAFEAERATLDLPGIFIRRPLFYKGPERPRLGDMSYSERAVFGV